MTLKQFSLQMAKAGCIGFGGGNALIPVLEKIFITDSGLDTKENFDRDIITANITPGALPVEIASGLGRRSFGKKGMVIGSVMMALPGALLALLLFTLLLSVQSALLGMIKIASVGISAFIICLLFHYIETVITVSREESRQRLAKSVFVILCVSVLACGNNLNKLLEIDRTPLFAISTLHILIAAFFAIFYLRSSYSPQNLAVCAVLCAIFFLGHGKAGLFSGSWFLYAAEILMAALALRGALNSIRSVKWVQAVDKKAICQDVAVWLAFLAVLCLPALLLCDQSVFLIGRGALSTLMSFGGGDAYLTIADGLFVESGMISAQDYYGDIVSVVNILPGSILCKTLVGIGYYVGITAAKNRLAGLALAAAGFACSIAVSCCTFGVVSHLYDGLSSSREFRVISRWIRPIIAGLLINVIISLLNQTKLAVTYTGSAAALIVSVTLGLAVADFLLAKFTKLSHIWLLLINVAAVFLLL